MSKFRTLFAALLLIGLASPGRAVDPTPTAEILESELRDHVRILAADDMGGRASGEPGAELAAAYISREFARAGLAPGGDHGSWLTWFGLPGGKPVPRSCSLRLTGQQAMDFAYEEDFKAFSFAQGGAVNGARIAFAGFGIRAPDLGYDDYQDLNVKGKVVVVLRHGPRERAADYRFRGAEAEHVLLSRKAEVAERAGAAALVVVNDVTRHPGRRDLCPANPPSVDCSVQIPVIYLTRRAAEALFAAAGEDLTALEETIDATGKPCSRTVLGVRADLKVRLESRSTANVLGILPGSDPDLADEVVVIGAHYDHVGTGKFGSLEDEPGGKVHNGADDNASGTAAVIELAEHFASAETPPRRTMLFIAFSGEERGLLGSRYYVEHPRFPLAKTVAMVNFDMIGRGGSGQLFIGGTGTSPVFPGLIKRGMDGRGLTLWQSPAGRAPSDNTPFFLRGIPAIFFHTGTHDDYHRSTDDWDKIDYEPMKQILDAALVITGGLASLDQVPRAADLGVRLAVGAGPPGPLVKLVEEGSPANIAMIRKGDRIVAIGGQRITDGREYKRVLGSYGVGRRVELVILREGVEHTLVVDFTPKDQ